MIFITTSVKYDLGDSCCESLFSNCHTDSLRNICLYVIHLKFNRTSSSQSVALFIVDNLCIDVIAASENSKPWSVSNTAYVLANAPMPNPPFSCIEFSVTHIYAPVPAAVLPALRRMTSSEYLMPLPVYGFGFRTLRI